MSDEHEYAMAALDSIFKQAKAQFGDAVKAQWFYAAESCPGCGGEVDAMKHEGKDALSLNAYIYRERGVLIGYMLCGKCAGKIMSDAKKNPYKETELHARIGENLVWAYKKYLRTLDA